MSGKNYHYMVNLSVLVLCCLSVLAGCATVQTKRLVPESYEVEKRHPKTVEIKISGGIKSVMGAIQQIPIEKYKEAFYIAMQQSKIFSAINKENSDYRLDIIVYGMKHEKSGNLFVYNQTAYSNWKLTDTDTNKIVFQERVDTTGSHTAFSGATRTVRATEDAVRKNIKEGIRRLSELDLK